MIRPKHSFSPKAFSVKEVFIDREEAKALYRDKLRRNMKEYNLLVYYGTGGIGKSKLRKERLRIHREENDKGLTIYLDLNTADDRNLGNGILKLANSCSKKYTLSALNSLTPFTSERSIQMLLMGAKRTSFLPA